MSTAHGNAQRLIAAGYVRCPNVPNRWYAGGPNIMEPAHGFDLFASETEVTLDVQPYGKFNRSDAVTVYRFDDADDVLRFLSRHGVKSEPGGSHIPGRFLP